MTELDVERCVLWEFIGSTVGTFLNTVWEFIILLSCPRSTQGMRVSTLVEVGEQTRAEEKVLEFLVFFWLLTQFFSRKKSLNGNLMLRLYFCFMKP